MPGEVHYLDARIEDGLRIYAIGDVHGRLDLLRQMHERIGDETLRDRPDRRIIIHLGDYVDRGPDAAGVIDFLSTATENDGDIVALAGNHDHGFIDFMNDGDLFGLFAQNGGEETARSYGIIADFTSEEGARRTAAALRNAVPGKHIAFLQRLPVKAVHGDFYFCHAGVRPNVPLDQQDPWDLVWIRYEFLAWPQLYEKVIVHGHTPHGEPEVLPNRVNIDTAAFASGVLTALVIDGAQKRFLEARA